MLAVQTFELAKRLLAVMPSKPATETDGMQGLHWWARVWASTVAGAATVSASATRRLEASRARWGNDCWGSVSSRDIGMAWDIASFMSKAAAQISFRK
jgi:hypothetical protein